jgi:capsular exopolysaccharide synthesis family protein
MARLPQDLDGDGFEPGPGRRSLNLFQIAWNRKSLLLLGTVCGLVLAGLYYAQKAPVYQSSAQVLVLKKYPEVPVLGLDSKLGAAYYDDYVLAQVEVIRSPLIVRRAVAKAGLGRLQSFAGQGDPTAAIIGALAAARGSKDGGNSANVLNLTYRGPVSEECGLVLMAVIDSYQGFINEKHRKVSDERLERIMAAMKETQEQLGRDKEEQKKLRLDSPLVLIGGKEGSAVGREGLANIEVRRSALRMRAAEIEGRLAAIEAARKDGRDPTPLMEMAVDQTKGAAVEARPNTQALLDAQLLPLLLEEQKLLETFGKDHPDVVAVRKRIQLTRDFFARGQTGPAAPAPSRPAPQEVEAYVQTLKRQLEDARKSVESLTELFNRERKEAKELENYAFKEEDLRERIAANQQRYKDQQRRWEEIAHLDGKEKADAENGGYEASILSEAGPGGKVEPRPVPLFGLGGVLGLLVGLVLAVLAEVSDKSFRTPDEIRRRLGLPIVGHIPYLRPDEAALARARAQGVHVDPLLCAYLQSTSVQAEAYRGVRTSLYFSTQDQRHQVIQITSPGKGDGKTTMAANLAVSIAQSGKAVLVVDADFRRPRQHRVFGLSAGLGLASVMEGAAAPEDAIQSTVVPNLWLLPCGPRPANPAELLTSPRFEELLDGLRQRYDFVLIDTPPLLAVSDPSVVAPRADGVLLAIRVSKNGRPQAERAKEMLSTLGANILGVVVNGVGRSGGDGYEDGEYGAAYGYGYAYDSYEPEDAHSYHKEGGSSSDVDLEVDPAAAKRNGSGAPRPGSNSDVDLGADPGAHPRTTGDSSRVRRRQHPAHRGPNGPVGRRRPGVLAWLRGLWS